MNAQKERGSNSENFGTTITRFLSFGAIFVDFSEARDLFVIIFQIPRPKCKIMDCVLILEKPSGLNVKCPKLYFSGIVFLKETCGPRAAPVHGGPRSPSRRRLAGERPEWCPHAWNLTAVEGKGTGDGGDPH
jgi:hypothetical protein